MKKIKKYFLIVGFVILIFFAYFLLRPSVTEASAGDNILSNVQKNSNSLLSTGENAVQARGINVDFEFLVGLVQVMYVILCVIFIIRTIQKAIKYGLSNASDKAAAKKELAGWLIICVCGIGVFPLFRLIVSAFDDSTYTANVVNQFKNTSEGLSEASQNSPILIILNTILRMVQVAGIGYVIIRFTVAGIKYFSASATASQKADIKAGELQRSLIIAVIVFGAVGFFEIIYQAVNG